MIMSLSIHAQYCFTTTFPPAAEDASNHPKSCLLGFSAALAPKFHPDGSDEEDDDRGDDHWRSSREPRGRSEVTYRASESFHSVSGSRWKAMLIKLNNAELRLTRFS